MITFDLWQLTKDIVGQVPAEYEFVYFIVLAFLCMALIFILISPFMLLIKLIGGE